MQSLSDQADDRSKIPQHVDRLELPRVALFLASSDPRFRVPSAGEDLHSMTVNLVEVRSIDRAAAEMLSSIGISTTREILEACATREGRDDVHRRTGIGVGLLLRWAGLAELTRIQGLSSGLAEMLCTAGIGSIDALRDRNARRLADMLLAIKNERNLPGLVPSAAVIEGWIAQAKRMRSELQPTTHDPPEVGSGGDEPRD